MSNTFSNEFLEHGVYSTIGKRKEMEDRHSSRITSIHQNNTKQTLGLFGVYDGHGGTFAADYCAQHFTDFLLKHPKFPDDIEGALKEACQQFDSQLLEESEKKKTYSGCTLNFVVVSRQYLLCCNVGDSRAVLSRKGQVIPLSKDHNISNAAEVLRVKNSGGFITHRGINDYMLVTRAMGDLDLKGHKHRLFPDMNLEDDLVISTPEITCIQSSMDDEFLIIACDGLWCRINDMQAVKLAYKVLRKYGSAKIAAKYLVQTALSMGSSDNITVMIVILHRQELMRDVTVHGGNIFQSLKDSKDNLLRKRNDQAADSSDDSGHGRHLFLNSFRKGKLASASFKQTTNNSADTDLSTQLTCLEVDADERNNTQDKMNEERNDTKTKTTSTWSRRLFLCGTFKDS
eukprot:jgi/Galph1/3008/GphlegSOOS_G1682.1